MGEVWTNRETARKERLLDVRLRTNAKVVLRCAECILARPAPVDDSACFTSTEIERCTGLSQTVVTSSLKKPLDAGYLDKAEAPLGYLTGNKRPMLYSPQSNDGRDFFIPEPRRGCERTATSNTLESLTQTERNILARVADVLPKEHLHLPITATMIMANSGMDRAVVMHVFTTFIRCGVLINTSLVKHGSERRALEYELTDYGKGLVLASEPWTRPNDLEKEPASINSATLQFIQDNYPSDQYDGVVKNVLMLLDIGVVKHRPPSQLPDNGAVLWFDAQLQAMVGKNGCLAIAHWLDLAPLIYGKRFHPTAVARAISIPNDVDFGLHVRKQYYEPMIDKLMAARRESGITK